MQSEDILPEHIEAIQVAVNRIPEGSRAEFELRFDAWRAAWSKPGIRFSSNSRDYAKVPEFDALIELGSVILPLVEEKLINPENHFVLHLYEALQSQQDLIAREESIVEGQQGRSKRTVIRYASSLSS